MYDWWDQINEASLSQGDILANCPIFNIPADFDATTQSQEITIDHISVIVVTQSCDLANGKVRSVAVCPIYTLEEYGEALPNFKKPSEMENLRKGRYEGTILLDGIGDKHKCFVVDFRELFSIPFDVLVRHAELTGERYRLKSPYLEYFSQNFARFFMRVGLPKPISAFK